MDLTLSQRKSQKAEPNPPQAEHRKRLLREDM
jgi:hypothetical protein